MKLWIIVILLLSIILLSLTWRSTVDQRQVTGQRIISLSPALTEILFELGLGQQIVGASEFSDHPPAAQKIPRMGK